MAAYIPVPRDLTRVKTKVFFNLTKRQLLCFGAAALIGVPIFFLVKATGNVSLAALSMMIVMLPLFFLAMYEKDSQPLEVVVEHFIQTKFVRPKFSCVTLRLLIPSSVPRIVRISSVCSLRTKETMR